MKIGILTMQYRKNYGGILQAYALMKVIESMGHTVEHIDFRYEPAENTHCIVKMRNFTVGFLKKIGIKKVTSINKSKRELPLEHIQAFADFKHKYLKYSKDVYNNNIHEIVNNYDCIVVGSDQVWNNVEGKFLHFFFDYKAEFKGKKIAYAPCAVFTKVPWYNRHKLNRLLHNFNAISVRDNTTANLVYNILGSKPQIVLDPTCLYDFSEFAERNPIVEGDYIFAYILGSELHGGHKNIINKIQDKYGKMKVVAAIIPDISLEVEKFADKIMYNINPSDWVNLIAHSKFIYTDSFHGCMFAMKFHKPFFAYYRDSSRTSRLLDIKQTYNMPNIFMSGDNYKINDINYENIDIIMNNQKKSSIKFLNENLNK